MWSKALLTAVMLFVGVGQVAHAQVLFERAEIRIDARDGQGQPDTARGNHLFNVELRAEEALGLEYIHTLNELTDNSGVLILLNSPLSLPLPMMKVYTPVDALFVAADGTILQILPNAVLADVVSDISAPKPILAFVFLKAGTVEKLGLQPRDVIAGRMFTPRPAVRQ